MKLKELFVTNMSWETAVGLSGLTLGLSAACLITHLPGNSSEWAYWVQAVGSIGAIIGAFSIGQSQIRAARDQADEERRATKELNEERRRIALESKRAASRAIVSAAYGEVAGFTKYLHGQVVGRKEVSNFYRSSVLSELVGSVGKIPIFELEDAEVAVCLLGFQNSLLSIRDILDRFEEPNYHSNGQIFYNQELSTTELRGYIISAYHSYCKVLDLTSSGGGALISFKPPPFECKKNG